MRHICNTVICMFLSPGSRSMEPEREIEADKKTVDQGAISEKERGIKNSFLEEEFPGAA